MPKGTMISEEKKFPVDQIMMPMLEGLYKSIKL
jgi:hypothetical protein